MPHLLAWFGVTKDRKQGTRFMETIDDERQRFSITYQLVRNWNVETLLGHLSPERARNIELEGQVASMGEEIRALKRENARLRRENQDLLSGNVTSKRKRVSPALPMPRRVHEPSSRMDDDEIKNKPKRGRKRSGDNDNETDAPSRSHSAKRPSRRNTRSASARAGTPGPRPSRARSRPR
ncbi:hypothetical protein THAOC_17857 [Thalassiosira oceanica]|uniref:Uncharacterized protein n=1 Tax=Thalassiosira oceanica TaxID=159749 RepID=K0S6C0_THAOC|nr:hypothetical protein THAOC_17857 [Thalassiosira oceanica]|eukprot:EJK61623.1 hypothetical protein THAOC_17857 [Thalassiosira oceanica]